MRILNKLIVLCITGIFLVSCDSGSSSGTSGGSGESNAQEAAATADTQEPSNQSQAKTAASQSDSSNTGTSKSTITLSATSDFACSGNWSYRDGAMALAALMLRIGAHHDLELRDRCVDNPLMQLR